MSEDVPGYRVLKQIGEGGFSVVYLAYQERLDRQVALKVLSISAIDKAPMRRFQRECKITGRLTGHPNVVTVLDTGTTRSGRPYIAMEYFEHGSLTDRLLREGPLPLPEVLRIGVKMAGALAATHETDVLHRDVKPQNILMSRYGEPALADFGIARLVDSLETPHTNAFTPHHAAPEVLEGRPPGVSSDLYSLGSTLYQLLAGWPAFRARQNEGIAQLMLRILGEPLPMIPRDDVPRPVFDVIGQVMAKVPEQRFPSAVAFAQRLRQLQGELGLPVTELAHSGGVFVPPAPGPPGGGFQPPIAVAPPPASVTPVRHPEPVARAATVPPDAGAQTEGVPGAEAEAPTARIPPSAPIAPDPAAPAPPGSPHPHQWRPESTYADTRVTSPPTDQQPTGPAGELGPTGPPGLTGPPGSTGRRRGLLVACAVALVGGLSIGIAGAASSGGSRGGDDPRVVPSATTPATPVAPTGQAGGTPPVVRSLTPRQIKAAAPRNVRLVMTGTSARVSWTLPPGARRLPIIVQRSPLGRRPVTSAGTGGRALTVGGLKPHGKYCFRVGALLAPGSPPTIAWSGTRCGRVR
ncbi:protein kinase domain-containing protein [Actinomadura scrupuli]|uniref:serine/threonine-protein kinase n=1 Tax=Actinomadura scrupuli TaxID=559629 RepID=UPI003D99ADFE